MKRSYHVGFPSLTVSQAARAEMEPCQVFDVPWWASRIHLQHHPHTVGGSHAGVESGTYSDEKKIKHAVPPDPASLPCVPRNLNRKGNIEITLVTIYRQRSNATLLQKAFLAMLGPARYPDLDVPI